MNCHLFIKSTNISMNASLIKMNLIKKRYNWYFRQLIHEFNCNSFNSFTKSNSLLIFCI